MTNESGAQYVDLKERLDEIVELVSDDSIPLDDALKLYEEAVTIGMQATSLLEQDIREKNLLVDEQAEEPIEE